MTTAALIGLDHTVVTVGSAATFTCRSPTCTTESSEPRLVWSFAAVDEKYEYVYLICVAPKCSITLTNNNRTSLLTINDVQLIDAGQYKCSAYCHDHNSKAVSNLSVVGKEILFILCA